MRFSFVDKIIACCEIDVNEIRSRICYILERFRNRTSLVKNTSFVITYVRRQIRPEYMCLQHRIRLILCRVVVTSTKYFRGPERMRKHKYEWPRSSNFDLSNELLALAKKKPVETV